jgi:hypothetical protein
MTTYYAIIDPKTKNAVEITDSVHKVVMGLNMLKLSKAEYDILRACRGDAPAGIKTLTALQKRAAAMLGK